MSARGACFTLGGFLVTLGWTGLYGWPAAVAFVSGFVVGPCVYLNRAPWRL